jgi:hypothetical protein
VGRRPSNLADENGAHDIYDRYTDANGQRQPFPNNQIPATDQQYLEELKLTAKPKRRKLYRRQISSKRMESRKIGVT